MCYRSYLCLERKRKKEKKKGKKETINSAEQFWGFYFFWNYFKWEKIKAIEHDSPVQIEFNSRQGDEKEIKMHV